jgi:hypothetical protein
MLGGTAAPSYVLASTTAATSANITQRPLTVSATGVNKTFDGTTAATVQLTDNRVSGDSLIDSYTTATFASAGAGVGTTVNVAGIAISGQDAGNYALTSPTATATANIAKATPVIVWPTPAAIPSGSALGSAQLNATANVPGTFVYTPPAGTVPASGNNTLSVAFTPTDSADYTAASAQVVLAVNPSSPPSIAVTNVLTRDSVTNEVVAVITLRNAGGTAANNVKVTRANMSDLPPTTPLPVSAGTIGAGMQAQVTLRFPASVGVSGAGSNFTVGGSYTGGTILTTSRVTLP